MATIFAAFGKFGQNNKGSVQNFGIIGVTIATEELTKFIFFFCPCDTNFNEIYGSTFIWGPAFILLVVGFVINRKTWRLTTGMCNRTQGVGNGCKRLVHFLFIFLNISMKAILAPATWIVISFLKGDYYACAAWPGPNDPDAHEKFRLHVNASIPPPCSFSLKPPVYISSANVAEVIARDLRAYSHIIGWWFLAYALIIGIVFVFVFRCLSKYSYEQSKYIEKYRTSEMKLFDEALDAKAEAQAKIIVDQFFTKPRKKEEWDQIASINDKVMKSKRGRPIYSPLHKFVNKELVTAEMKQLDMVADSAAKKFHVHLGRKKKTGTAAKNGSDPSSSTKPTSGNSGGGGGMSGAEGMQMMAMGAMMSNRGKPKVQQVVHATPSGYTGQNQSQTTPQLPPKDEPIISEKLEEDPIQEANTAVDPGIRRSLILQAEQDDTEDPILEAHISQHPDIRESIERLSEAENFEVTDENEVTFSQETDENEVTFSQDMDENNDEAPLL